VIELVINSTISNQWLSGNGVLQNLAEPCNAHAQDGSCSVLKHDSGYLFMLAHVMLAAYLVKFMHHTSTCTHAGRSKFDCRVSGLTSKD